MIRGNLTYQHLMLVSPPFFLLGICRIFQNAFQVEVL